MAISDAAGLFERVKAALTSGSSARTRVGTFYVVTFSAYEGRNPRTDQVVPVPAKKMPFFVASDELTAAVLGPRAAETHASGHEEMEREATETRATLSPSTDVECNDAELDACVRALRAELAPGHRVEIAPLGAIELRQNGDNLRPHFQASDELKKAMNGA